MGWETSQPSPNQMGQKAKKNVDIDEKHGEKFKDERKFAGEIGKTTNALGHSPEFKAAPRRQRVR